jgi:hypothetical protein
VSSAQKAMVEGSQMSLLRKAYAAFNARDIDSALATMQPDVAWPNGMEGGMVHGTLAFASTGPGNGA